MKQPGRSPAKPNLSINQQHLRIWQAAALASASPDEVQFPDIPGTKGQLWYLRQQLYKLRTFAIEQGLPGADQWAGISFSIIDRSTGRSAKSSPASASCVMRLAASPIAGAAMAAINSLLSTAAIPPTDAANRPGAGRSHLDDALAGLGFSADTSTPSRKKP